MKNEAEQNSFYILKNFYSKLQIIDVESAIRKPKNRNEGEDKMAEKDSLQITGLLCGGMEAPLGISTEGFTFSWRIIGPGTNVSQEQCEIQIAEDGDFERIVYDETVETGYTSVEVRSRLEEKTRYHWRVRACIKSVTQESCWLDWSSPACFETALAGEKSWEAAWVEADEEFYRNAALEAKKELLRCPYLRTCWDLEETPVRARIYITAHGFYELHINGRKIGSPALAPDFTAYDKCIYYQTYDLTEYLQAGKNQVEVILADGWYAGHAQGIPGRNHLYGERPAVIFLAEADLKDGSVRKLCSDDGLEAWTGPLLYADLFMGEYLDMGEAPRRYGTVVREYPKNVLAAQEYGGIEEKTVLKAVSLKKNENGSWIIDFGQVLAGRERIHFLGEAGSHIKIERSELLNKDTGDLEEINPRFPFHEQTDYVCITEDSFVYEPQFSFQGYQFLKVSGLRGELTLEQCESVVLETAMRDTFSFSCSDPMLNQLVHNSYWSQCGNMISIPTDCPQRERGGFTGDAQIFCKTAAWHQDVQGFFRRWLKQCRLEQLRRGQIPIVVPYTDAYRKSEANPGWTSAGWGDAIIYVPWDLYESYGNKEILSENFAAMERWMDYVTACAEDSMPEERYMDFSQRPYQRYLWNSGYHWGDWLLPGYGDEEGVAVTKEITASLFYLRMADTMADICGVLEMEERKEYYTELARKIREAFLYVYTTEEGIKGEQLQSFYVLALAFHAVSGRQKKLFESRLNELVIEADYHLRTGFLSTPFLLDVLWEAGYEDTALRVLNQDTYPSWLYEVKMGATTIWEHWDEIRPDGSIFGGSFNHYAFGCVADFIYRRIGGVSSLMPGFKKVRIYPEAVEGISHAELSYETMFGELAVKWERKEGKIACWMKIPHGMTVVVGEDSAEVLGSGEWTREWLAV